MKKRSLLSCSLLAFSIALASAQVDLRMSDRMLLNGLGTPLKTGTESENIQLRRAKAAESNVELIVRFNTADALSAIHEAGGTIVSHIGQNTVIVSVPAQLADKVAACPGVTGAKVSQKVKPTNKIARQASNVDAIHQGKDLEQPYNGEGVVVGMFDIGLDPNHINFLDETGQSRVSRLWHYYDDTTANDEYATAEKIATFTTDYTSESHGTHVLGILGGNFSDPEDAEHDFHGMAPGADLAVAAGLGYEAQIVDALERISKYAREQNKPCVINLSFGDNLGPHDGTDEFTEAINNVAKNYGSIICMSVGNERDDKIALIKEATDDDYEIRTLLLPGTYNDSYVNLQSFGTIEIYGNDDTEFEVSIDIINRSKPSESIYSLEIPKSRATYLSQGSMLNDFGLTNSRTDVISSGTPFQQYYTESFIGGTRGLDNYNKRYHAQINAYLTSATATDYARYFVVLHIKAKPGKKVFVYSDGLYMNFGNKMMPGFDVPDGNGTNSNMGSGPYTIAVGSYVTANIEDSPYTFGNIGDISWFSSYGETPDGRFLPLICAPGQVIMSSRNSYMYDSQSQLYYYPKHYSYKDPKTKKTYNWTSCAGTSQASPHVAGIIALWLSANPELNLDGIKQILAETAAAATTQEAGWGAGRIDAYRGLKAALGQDYVASVKNDGNEALINVRDGRCEAFVAGASSVTLALYDISGALVRTVTANGDTAQVPTDGLQHGVYVARATASNASRTVKIAL